MANYRSGVFCNRSSAIFGVVVVNVDFGARELAPKISDDLFDGYFFIITGYQDGYTSSIVFTHKSISSDHFPYKSISV